MKVVIIGGGAAARIVSALIFLATKAAERVLDCATEVMDLIAGMEIVVVANAFDDGPSTRVLREKYGVPGYYADIADNLGAFCPDPMVAELFKFRFDDEIGGRSLGELLVAACRSLANKYGDERVRRAVCLLGEGNTENEVACSLLREALSYRFEKDGFKDHSFRNVFHFALEQVAQRSRPRLEAQRRALESLHLAYKVRSHHRVVAVAWASAVLGAETNQGEQIIGQSRINLRGLERRYPHEIKRMFLTPQVEASREARDAIASTGRGDKIIISCGDMLSTIVPALLAGGIREDILGSPAEMIYVANQITRRGETSHDAPYTVKELVDWIVKVVGRHPHRIIYDRTTIPKAVLASRYPGEEKIKLGGVTNYALSGRFERPILIRDHFGMKDAEGRWVHDPEALALRAFLKIFRETQAGALA